MTGPLLLGLPRLGIRASRRVGTTSVDAKKKAQLEEMKRKLIDAVSELQALKKLKVEIHSALKKA